MLKDKIKAAFDEPACPTNRAKAAGERAKRLFEAAHSGCRGRRLRL